MGHAMERYPLLKDSETFWGHHNGNKKADE
jgi:hypothetical protein